MDMVRVYLRAIGIITTLLGLSLLLFPSIVIGIFFNQINSQTEFFAGIAGSTLIGYSVINILASRTKDIEIQRLAVFGNLATLTIASLICLFYYDSFDSYGWLIVGEHIFFAGGFIVCAHKLKNR